MEPANFISWTELIKIMATFLAGITGGYLIEIIKKRIKATRVEIAFDPKKDVINTPDNPIDPTEMAIYIRVKITNNGSEYAGKLKCFLIVVERKNEHSSTGWDIIFDVPLELAWSYYGHIGALDLTPTMWTYFDVLKTNSKLPYIETATFRHPTLLNTELKNHGTYRFTYTVAGENLRQRTTGRMEVIWNGVWNELIVENNYTL